MDKTWIWEFTNKTACGVLVKVCPAGVLDHTLKVYNVFAQHTTYKFNSSANVIYYINV